MAQIIGLLDGTNINHDYQLGMEREVLLPSLGVIVNGLAVTSGQVGTGRAIIKCTRTNGQIVSVSYSNTVAVSITTSGTTKVWIAVNQAKLNDGSSNSVDGTGIAAIETGADYPAGNYIPLAVITSGVIVDARPLWIKQNVKSADIASAATVDLSTATGYEVHITGSTGPITSFGVMPAGSVLSCIFDSTPTITHSATSLILPGGANIVAAAGDCMTILSEGDGNWRCTGYQKANGTSVVVVATVTGEIRMWTTNVAPSGFLICTGTAVSRSTYSTLFATIVPSLGAFTVSIATPGVVSLTAHGMNIGDSFYVTTTGALPTGMVANTLYYVISAGYGANSFQFSATRGGAAINTSGTQSGTHTMRYCPFGLGDGSTTFNLPNFKGSVPVGLDTTQAEFLAIGKTGGEKTHLNTSAESGVPAHTHNLTTTINATSGGSTKGLTDSGNSTSVTAASNTAADAAQAHNNLQPYFTINFIIAI